MARISDDVLKRLLCLTLVIAWSFSGCFTQQAFADGEVADVSQIPEGTFSVDKGDGCLITKDSFDKLYREIWTLPQIIIDEDKEIVSVDNNLLLLLLAGGGSIAMHNGNADNKIEQNFDDKRVLSKFTDEMTYFLGGPGFHFAATGLWYLISESNDDPVNNERAWTMLKALTVTAATTMGLKLIRNNDTPNGKSLAWPSGHTSSSFTVAAVLDELYGPEVGIPAYIGAGFVGYRMMESGDHWGSDVLFGAVLGWIVGHQVAGKHKDPEIAGFKVIPFNEATENGTAMGLRLVKQF